MQMAIDVKMAGQNGLKGDGMIVVLYARISMAGQDADNQMHRLREVAEVRGFIVYAEYGSYNVLSGLN